MIQLARLHIQKFYSVFTNSQVKRNFSYLVLGDLASRGIQFITVIYLARVLTDRKYGMIAYALAIQSYLLTFVDFGLPTLGTRELAKDKSSEGRAIIVARVLSLRSIIALGLFLVSAILSILMVETTETRLVMIATFAFVFPQVLNFDWVFQGFEQMSFVGISRFSYQALAFIAIFLVINNPSHVVHVPIIRCVVGLIFSFAIIILCFRFELLKIKNFISITSKTNNWKNLLNEAWPLAGISFLGLVFNTFDVFILGITKGAQVVGWYSSATVFFILTLSIASSMFQAFFPRLSNAYADQNIVEFSRVYRLYWRSMLFVAVACTTGPALFGPFIVKLFFGPSYSNGGVALSILMIAAFLSFGNHTFGGALLSVGLQRYSLLATIVGAIVSVVSVVLLVPKWSLVGAAFSRVLAEIASASIHSYYLNRFLKHRD